MIEKFLRALGAAMPPTDDSGSVAKLAIGLENDVRRLLRCVEGGDRYADATVLSENATHFHPERIANSAFEIVTRLNKDHFVPIVRSAAFADLTVCITEFCKVSKYQKISLLAIAMLRGVIPTMLKTPECSQFLQSDKPQTVEEGMIKFWFPVLFGFYDIIMNGEDLEVRRLYVPFQLSRSFINAD